MPLYRYQCLSCEAEFELLIFASDVPGCPSCGGERLQQQLSKICSDLKTPGLRSAGRRAAAKAGHLSNYSRKERQSQPR
jgi:putative FmdB family regulatory protein